MVLRDGHQLAHALGRQAVATKGGDASVIRECRASFASGCYHGVVEAFVQSRGRVDMRELERMCLGAGSAERPGPIYECVHGLGHGVLGASGFNIQLALHQCDALSTSQFQATCHSGAFMEAISSAITTPPGGAVPSQHDSHGGVPSAHAMHAPPSGQRLSLDRGNPYSPCDRFDDPYATECWLFQGFLILRRTGFDAAQAFRLCDGAPAGRTAGCYQSVGHQLTGLLQRGDAWIVHQCEKGRPTLASQCSAGAARALDQIDWSGTRAAQLCAESPTAWKNVCYQSAAATLTTLASRTERRVLCARVEPAFVSMCLEAAELNPSSDRLR